MFLRPADVASWIAIWSSILVWPIRSTAIRRGRKEKKKGKKKKKRKKEVSLSQKDLEDHLKSQRRSEGEEKGKGGGMGFLWRSGCEEM